MHLNTSGSERERRSQVDSTAPECPPETQLSHPCPAADPVRRSTQSLGAARDEIFEEVLEQQLSS